MAQHINYESMTRDQLIDAILSSNCFDPEGVESMSDNEMIKWLYDSEDTCNRCGEYLFLCDCEEENEICDSCGKTFWECECPDEEEDEYENEICDSCGKTLWNCECPDEEEDEICDSCGKTLWNCECPEEEDEICVSYYLL